MAYVPIAWDGEVRYVAILISHEPRDFDAEAIEFAKTAANQAAAALALLESERRRALQARARRRPHARRGRAERLARARRGARDAHPRGRPRHGRRAGRRLPRRRLGRRHRHRGPQRRPEAGPGSSSAAARASRGRVLDAPGSRSSPTPTRPRWRSPTSRSAAIKTAAGVPMAWNGELKGALSVGFTEMRRVTDEDLRALEAIAAFAVVACQNAEAYQLARVAATTDALTGLINHGALQLRVREEISAPAAPARRSRACCSTSTTSRPSTTTGPPGRRRAAAGRRPTPCAASCATTTSSPATAATSSSSCSPAPTAPAAAPSRTAWPPRCRGVLDRRRPVERAADGRRAARPRRPRAAAGQAHRQVAGRGGQRRARAGARARRGARRLARGDHARVLGGWSRPPSRAARRCDAALLRPPRDRRRRGRAL